ncbi:MAG: hypothetical protein KC492_15750 [Myxococcales bacterium]|nr:hypothetical protein [Myxococcales bacterium]
MTTNNPPTVSPLDILVLKLADALASGERMGALRAQIVSTIIDDPTLAVRLARMSKDTETVKDALSRLKLATAVNRALKYSDAGLAVSVLRDVLCAELKVYKRSNGATRMLTSIGQPATEPATETETEPATEPATETATETATAPAPARNNRSKRNRK